MALPNTTTLSAAVGVNDITVLLASLTNVVAGNLIKIDDEFMKILSVPAAATTPVPVLRGQEGSAQKAHLVTTQVQLGANPSASVAGDWGNPAAGGPNPVVKSQARVRTLKNYAAAGAIDLPDPGTDRIAVIDGTGALAMTLANPSVLNDGDMLIIVGNGKAAHTVTYAAGLGNGGGNLDLMTFAAGGQQSLALIAANGIWVLATSILSGTLTNITVTMA